MKSQIINVTTKGQIVVPKKLRDKYNIKPFSQVIVGEENDQITIRPAITTDEAAGMFRDKIKKYVPESSYDDAVQNAIEEKYRKELDHE